MKRMKQKEWLSVIGLTCPLCRSNNVSSGGVLGPYEYERICDDCGTEFDEIYKPVGYKITKKGWVNLKEVA